MRSRKQQQEAALDGEDEGEDGADQVEALEERKESSAVHSDAAVAAANSSDIPTLHNQFVNQSMYAPLPYPAFCFLSSDAIFSRRRATDAVLPSAGELCQNMEGAIRGREGRKNVQTSKLQRAHPLQRGGSLSSSQQPECLPLTLPALSRHLPLMFHCDRLTSSADLNLIHFCDHA